MHETKATNDYQHHPPHHGVKAFIHNHTQYPSLVTKSKNRKPSPHSPILISSNKSFYKIFTISAGNIKCSNDPFPALIACISRHIWLHMFTRTEFSKRTSNPALSYQRSARGQPCHRTPELHYNPRVN